MNITIDKAPLHKTDVSWDTVDCDAVMNQSSTLLQEKVLEIYNSKPVLDPGVYYGPNPPLNLTDDMKKKLAENCVPAEVSPVAGNDAMHISYVNIPVLKRPQEDAREMKVDSSTKYQVRPADPINLRVVSTKHL